MAIVVLRGVKVNPYPADHDTGEDPGWKKGQGHREIKRAQTYKIRGGRRSREKFFC